MPIRLSLVDEDGISKVRVPGQQGLPSSVSYFTFYVFTQPQRAQVHFELCAPRVFFKLNSFLIGFHLDNLKSHETSRSFRRRLRIYLVSPPRPGLLEGEIHYQSTCTNCTNCMTFTVFTAFTAFTAISKGLVSNNSSHLK